MDFTVANLQFHKGKWKHGKRKARLPLEVFVVTKKDDNIDTKKLLIANFDFDANTNFNKIKTSSMENSIPLTNICNNTNNNNYNNIIAINEKKLIDENYNKINKKDVVEKDRTQQKNSLIIRHKALNTFSPAKGNNCNDLLIISPSETTSSCSNGDSMASPELSIYDLPSPSISHQQQEQPQSKLITVGRMSSQMPLGNASVVSKGDETEKEDGKNVGVINANILQKQNINMKYNNANSKSDEVSPTAVLVSKNNVKNNNIDNNNYITNLQTPQLITSALFQTGSGNAVKVSKDSLNEASSFLSSNGSSVNLSSSNKAKRKSDNLSTLVTPRPLKMVKSSSSSSSSMNSSSTISCASLFQTGSGRRVNISTEKLNAASKLLQSSDVKNDSNNSNNGKSEFKTPRPIANKSNMPSASLFQTGSGRRVNISTEKLNDASKLLQSSEKIYNHEKDSATFITPKLVKKKSKSRQKDDTSIQLKKMSTLKNKSGGKRKGFVTPRIIQKPGHAEKHKNDEGHISTMTVKRQYKAGRTVDMIKMKRSSTKQLKNVAEEENTLTAQNVPLANVSVYQEALDVTSENAVGFSFQSEFGDKLTWKDFRMRLIQSEGMNEKYLSDKWVANHYRRIIWKLSAMERRFPRVCRGKFLTPKRVLDQLIYRYKREVSEGARSALRIILEGDSPPNRLMVLIVSKIDMPDALSNPNERGKVVEDFEKNTNGKFGLELSDGWYSIKGMVDSKLWQLIQNGTIKLGTKLAVQQASLINWNAGVNPLDCSCNNVHDFSSGSTDPKLCISKNSSRIAAWDSKLGFQPMTFFNMNMSTFDPAGGVVGCVDVYIERVYPMVYVERLLDGSSIFRSERSEAEAQESFERTIAAADAPNTDDSNYDRSSHDNMGSNGDIQRRRNVNPIFQADMIDAINGFRIRGSITFWKASEDFRSQIMTNRHWRFFGLTPSNHNKSTSKNICFSYNYGQRSQCCVLPDIDGKTMIGRGYKFRHRSLIGEVKYYLLDDSNKKRFVIDAVATMVGECLHNDQRFLFFVDESGSILSILLNKNFHKDISKYREGSICVLLNLCIIAHDKQNDVMQSEWKENSTTLLSSCDTDYRSKLNMCCNHLRKWNSSLEGKVMLEHVSHTVLPKLISNNISTYEISPKIVPLSKIGYIVGYKYSSIKDNDSCDDGNKIVIIDFQDGHGFQMNLTTKKSSIPFHKYLPHLDKLGEWYNLPIQFHQITLRPFLHISDKEKTGLGELFSFEIISNQSRLLEFGRI